MPEPTRVGNECFISSELRGGIGESVCSILLILLHGAGLSPLKTLETHWFSADYKYAWKSIHIWQWGREKLRKTQEESRGPGMFIFIYYSHLFSFSLFPLLHMCTNSLPYLCTHIHKHTHTDSGTHTHAHAQQERGRERICPDQQIIHSFLCDRPCGAVQYVIASALLWRLARLYICHFRSIREAREQSETQVHSSIDFHPGCGRENLQFNKTQIIY